MVAESITILSLRAMMTLIPLRVSVSGPGLPVLTGNVLMTLPLRRTVRVCDCMLTLLTMDGPTVKVVPPSVVTHLLSPVCTPCSAADTVTSVPGSQKLRGRHMSCRSSSHPQAPGWTGTLVTVARFSTSARRALLVTAESNWMITGIPTPSEFEANLIWANGVKQVVKTTLDDSPFGAIINKDGQSNGVKFEGTDGWIWVNRGDLAASDENIISTPLPDSAVRLDVSNDHMGNFFDCVRSRKDPISKVEVGHRSACVGHLIVIALRSGRKLQWDPATEFFVGDGAKEANAQVAREMRKPYDYGFVG